MVMIYNTADSPKLSGQVATYNRNGLGRKLTNYLIKNR